LSNDFLHLPPKFGVDILKAIKSLIPSKSVTFRGIPGFITKGSSTIFEPLLEYVCDLNLSPEHFPTQREKAVIVPIFKKGSSSPVRNYTLISLLNNLSKFSEFFIHDHTSHYFKHKLNPSQHGFPKAKSTTNNLVNLTLFNFTFG
jgi:hypothetical protein